MKNRLIILLSMFISSIVMIAAGLMVIYNHLFVESFIVNAIQLITIFYGVISIVNFIFNREKKSIVSGVLYIFLGILIEYKIKFIESSLILIVGIYAFINFIVQLISTTILYKNKAKLWKVSIINTGISLFFSVMLIDHPLKSKNLLEFISGIYLILFGIDKLIKFLRKLLDDKTKNTLKSKIRIRLPVIYTAIIPQKLLETINNSLSVESKKIFVESKSQEKGELEIFIHISKKMANGFGHVDICFGDTIYSYGTYDECSNRLFGFVSDGVLIESTREKYIENSTKTSHLVSFVLKLNKEQYKAIDEKIKLIKSQAKRWYCDMEKNPAKNYDDCASQIYLATNCKFYKFNSGYFKTYFVFTTNCVKFADSVICAAGIGGVSINGIITPGVYFKMFNSLF